MNPLDKSWEFLKAPVDEKKFRFEQKQRDDEAAAQEKKARDAQSARTKQTKLNLGPSKTGAPGSAKDISDMHQRMADVHTAISNARKRIGTTSSTGSVDEPTEGTGFENLTDEQINDIKNRRKQFEEADIDARIRSLQNAAAASNNLQGSNVERRRMP